MKNRKDVQSWHLQIQDSLNSKTCNITNFEGNIIRASLSKGNEIKYNVDLRKIADTKLT